MHQLQANKTFRQNSNITKIKQRNMRTDKTFRYILTCKHDHKLRNTTFLNKIF